MRGGSIWAASLRRPWRRGDEEGGTPPLRGRLLVGLSYDEARMRAISSSARNEPPARLRLALGRSASEVSSRAFWLERRTDDSSDEM